MESRGEKRLRCWESVFPKGVIEAPCPVCGCSTLRYTSTSGNTFQQMHIVPHSKQGSDQSWNLLPGCGCNQNMRHMNLLDWMGTKGNKRQLLKPVMLAKYKSLVAPCYRMTYDCEQLIKWVYKTYHPSNLEEYRDWLILLESDLAVIQTDGTGSTSTSSSTSSTSSEPVIKTIKEEPQPVKEECALVRSPYFERTYHFNARAYLAHTNIHMAYF